VKEEEEEEDGGGWRVGEELRVLILSDDQVGIEID